jgi:hypothetical protein
MERGGTSRAFKALVCSILKIVLLETELRGVLRCLFWKLDGGEGKFCRRLLPLCSW